LKVYNLSFSELLILRLGLRTVVINIAQNARNISQHQ
jgi:hypothetical protein